MDTTLVFSLLFIYYSISPKDLRDYDCHVESSSEALSERTGNLNILLQESEKAVTKGKLSRNHTVATWQCSGPHSPIQVNLLYSEKMFEKTLYKPNVKYTLQSLKLITYPAERVSTAHSCLLLRDYKQRFQTEFNLTGKVILTGISNCIIKAKLSEPGIFAEQLNATTVHQQNSSSGIGEDKQLRLRQRQSIYVKVVIICVLLPCALAFIVFVIFEVPFPCIFQSGVSLETINHFTTFKFLVSWGGNVFPINLLMASASFLSAHALVGASDATVFRNVKGMEKKAQKPQVLYHPKLLPWKNLHAKPLGTKQPRSLPFVRLTSEDSKLQKKAPFSVLIQAQFLF
ncbi:uncharacterized protein C17orf78 homolog [Carettochelys insculpta]|uniref:uncharacterized protein C17orf78 homolog n=1 Tax=Carettochelys insculpta TaxID=44489 RepID=UPI003EBED69B